MAYYPSHILELSLLSLICIRRTRTKKHLEVWRHFWLWCLQVRLHFVRRTVLKHLSWLMSLYKRLWWMWVPCKTVSVSSLLFDVNHMQIVPVVSLIGVPPLWGHFTSGICTFRLCQACPRRLCTRLSSLHTYFWATFLPFLPSEASFWSPILPLACQVQSIKSTVHPL